MDKRQAVTCAKCRYYRKGFCTIKAQQVADPTRDRMCKTHRK